MTTTPTVGGSDVAEQQTQPRTWGHIATDFAGTLAQYAVHRRGDLAELRRMDPDLPEAAAFWRLMSRENLLGNPEVESKWGLILHGIALMTPNNSDEGNIRTAYDRDIPVGEALYFGGQSQRSQPFYSETRLNRLLTARESMLRTLLARMFRMLAAAHVSFDWYEMAQFIHYQDYNGEYAEQARRRIARAYYQAERRASQQSTEAE